MKATTSTIPVLMMLAFGCGVDHSSSQDASALASNGPVNCVIQTSTGNYVTAVGGGGRTTDVIHTDATRASTWEQFTLIDTGVGSPIQYGIRTSNGHYLTAVGGGGRISDVIHSDATQIRAWETFVLNGLGGNQYTIQTNDGRYLTAVGGGGKSSGDTIHPDATTPRSWEVFRFTCGGGR